VRGARAIGAGDYTCAVRCRGCDDSGVVGKPKTIHFTDCPTSRLAASLSRGWLAAILALLSGGFQLAVVFRVDLLPTPRQHILRRGVAGGTGRCCNAPRIPRPDAAHLPGTAVFLGEYTRSLTICASVRSCRYGRPSPGDGLAAASMAPGGEAERGSGTLTSPNLINELRQRGELRQGFSRG
jgi:hypothetical protein